MSCRCDQHARVKNPPLNLQTGDRSDWEFWDFVVYTLRAIQEPSLHFGQCSPGLLVIPRCLKISPRLGMQLSFVSHWPFI